MLHTKRHKSVIKANSKRFEYAREKGICTRCGKSFEPNGRTLCPDCRAKMDAILKKVRDGR